MIYLKSIQETDMGSKYKKLKNNSRHKKSQYEKYVIMAHSKTHNLPLSYDGYLRFKE